MQMASTEICQFLNSVLENSLWKTFNLKATEVKWNGSRICFLAMGYTAVQTKFL